MSRSLSAIGFVNQLGNQPDPTLNAQVLAVWGELGAALRRPHGAGRAADAARPVSTISTPAPPPGHRSGLDPAQYKRAQPPRGFVAYAHLWGAKEIAPSPTDTTAPSPFSAVRSHPPALAERLMEVPAPGVRRCWTSCHGGALRTYWPCGVRGVVTAERGVVRRGLVVIASCRFGGGSDSPPLPCAGVESVRGGYRPTCVDCPIDLVTALLPDLTFDCHTYDINLLHF